MNEIMIQISTVFENKFLYALLIFIMFDVITGTLKSFSTNTVYSKINKHGITSNVTIFLFCIFFTWVFYFFEMKEYSKVLLTFYIISYGLSIIENLSLMGLPLPQWLIEKFKVLQDETNTGVKNNENKRDK